jgi:hypothetical protein
VLSALLNIGHVARLNLVNCRSHYCNGLGQIKRIETVESEYK